MPDGAVTTVDDLVKLRDNLVVDVLKTSSDSDKRRRLARAAQRVSLMSTLLDRGDDQSDCLLNRMGDDVKPPADNLGMRFLV